MAARGHRLDGRVALVTGGAKRVGRQLVLDLAAAGASVAIHYRRSDTAAQATAEAAARQGAKVALVAGDLADETVPMRLVEEAAAALGPLDILVNNASIFDAGTVLDTDAVAWDRHQAINLKAPFLLTQAFARVLPPDCEGAVVNLNDWRALRPADEHLAYTVSKVGLHGLTRSLAVALAPRIRVNELALGAVLPPEGVAEGYIHTLREEIPLRRFSALESVGQALLHLVENRDVTGQTLVIDGGRHLV